MKLTSRAGTPLPALRSLALLAATGLLATTGLGQTPPAPAPEDDTTVLEKFVVTGTNIGNAGDALAIPVTVITPADIANSGIDSNVLDVLRKVSPAITGLGGENATIATGQTDGGSQVIIHNLPTLVLVNGRRMAYDPVAGAGGSEFVDVNAIPLGAIERVEVLSDGSSAIYGADAIGGVVNIILKKDYNGWEADTHYGYSDTTGHYSERSASLSGGVSNGDTSANVSFEYTQSDPIYEAQRPYVNPFYGTTYVPGILEIFSVTQDQNNPIYGYDEAYQLAPGLNAPPGGGKYSIQQLVAMGVYKDLGSFSDNGVFTAVQHILNLANKETLQEGVKRTAATINLDHKIFGDKLEGFGYMLYAHVITQSSLNAQPLFPYISDPNSDLGFTGTTPPASGTEYVPISAATNPLSQASLDQGSTDGSNGYAALVHDRFENYPRIFQDDNQSFTGVAGLRGQINADWSWEVAADLSRYQDNYTNQNLLDTTGLIAAFADGQVNPFAITQAPGALDGVLGTAFVNYLSTNDTFDALVRGAILDLPGGKVRFALGADISRQNLTAVPDVNTANNLWIDSPTILPFNANRTISSVYAELEVPIVDKSHPLLGIYSLSLDAAGRYDDYSGQVGHSEVPKASLKYQPFDDELTLRASAGKSFIAPPLYALYGPVTQGSSSSITYTGANGSDYSDVQFQSVSGSNPNLKPSTATTWDVGFVVTPKAVPNLSVTADYFDTVQHKTIGTVDETTVIQSVEDLGAASPYASLIHFGSPTGPGPNGDTPGQISSRPTSSTYIVDPDLNLGAVAIKGFDVSVNYAVPTASFGRFELNSTLTGYSSDLVQVLPSENYYQYAGHTATIPGLALGEGGTVPRWRTYSSLEWKFHGLDVLAAQSFVPRVTDIGSGGIDAQPPREVASFDQWDFAVAYKLSALHWSKWTDGLKIRVGVNNAFDYQPPVAPYDLQNTLADISNYNGAVGRMFYTDVSYKF